MSQAASDHLDVGPRPPPGRRGLRRRWAGLRPRWRVAAVMIMVLVLAAIGVGVQRARTAPPALTQADVDRAVSEGIEQARKDDAAVPPAAAAAYAAVLPSMVTITARQADGGTSTGAGVIINDRGQVLTALHVVSPAAALTVRFPDQTSTTATIASSEPGDDIAVLDLATLPAVVVPAVIGGGAQIGAPVFAVGNPLGLSYSLTAGVVSGLDRSAKVPAQGGRAALTLEGMIQFDAAVNPGSSGGPLLDPAGHVLGVVTGLANPSGQPYFAGVGFAVPIGTAGGAGGPPY